MRFLPRPWLLLLLVVLVLAGLLQGLRLQRVRQLTALPEWSVDRPVVSADSPTGYADGVRLLLVDDPSGQSQQEIAQAQRMLAERRWQLPRVDYDNAPFGRDNHLSGLYRGWLAGLGWLDSTLTGSPAGVAVERTALYADLLLQILAAAVTGWFAWRHFGALAGGLVVLGLFTLYPLATNFIPGAPQSQGLGELCILWSLLPLAVGLRPECRHAARHFGLAGFAGGVGLALSFNPQLSLLAGIALGAVLHAGFTCGTRPATPVPWLNWGLGGALASLLLYLADYFPHGLSLRLEGNHPAYALGWLALAGMLHTLLPWVRDAVRPRPLALGAAGVALLMLAGLVALIVWQHPPLLASDITAERLTRLHGGFSAASLLRWTSHEGLSLRGCATVLPAVLLLPAVLGLLARSRRSPAHAPLAFLLGPLVVTLGLAGAMLRWWNTFDSVALATLAAALAGRSATGAVRWILGAAVPAALGLLLLVPPRATFRAEAFTPAEMQAVLERDLAHWIAQRRPDAVILAPPALTTPLWYYGGTRGITTFDAANREGLMGALRIAGALTTSEAQVLLQRRQATHLVLPSWDHGLDESAREISASTKSLFIEQLRDWIPPQWLRPVAYYAPDVEGFAANTVTVFELVDEQTESVWLSQLARHFVEAGLPGHAAQLRKFLQRLSADLNAHVALAEIEAMRNDRAEFDRALASVVTGLAGRADQNLPWDRRIALAAVLAQGGRDDLARPQLQRCFAQANEARLRALSPRSLFRFLALGRNHGLQIADPPLRELAVRLLPPETRERLR